MDTFSVIVAIAILIILIRLSIQLADMSYKLGKVQKDNSSNDEEESCFSE